MHRTSEDVHNAKFAIASEWDAADDKAKIAIQVSRGEAAVSRQVLAINAQFEGQWIRAYSKSTYDGPEDDDLKMEEFAREKAFNLALGALYLGHFDDGTRYKVEFTSEAVRSDPLLFAFQSAPTRDIKIRWHCLRACRTIRRLVGPDNLPLDRLHFDALGEYLGCAPSRIKDAVIDLEALEHLADAPEIDQFTVDRGFVHITTLGMSWLDDLDQQFESTPARPDSRDVGEGRPADADGFEFDIAISFAGEQRSIAEKVEKLIGSAGIRCYYDRKYAVESWGEDVAPYFADAFRNRARHYLVLWSKEYSVKQWPRFELSQAILRAINERHYSYILPVPLDATPRPIELDGLIWLPVRDWTADAIAKLVMEKLRLPAPNQRAPVTRDSPRELGRQASAGEVKPDAKAEDWAAAEKTPRFLCRQEGVTKLQEAFQPTWRLERTAGVPVDFIDERIRGRTFGTDWKRVEEHNIARMPISAEFDLSNIDAAVVDERLGVDEIGVEIRFSSPSGRWHHTLWRWPLSRKELPHKTLVEIGELSGLPERWTEQEP